MNQQFIDDNFCDAEISRELKELGFNEMCFTAYSPDGTLIHPFNIEYEDSEPESWDSHFISNSEIDMFGYVAAPLYQQVTAWLRNTHKIHVETSFFGTKELYNREEMFYTCHLNKEDVTSMYGFSHIASCGTHFGSYSAAMKAGIKHAISILKQQKTL